MKLLTILAGPARPLIGSEIYRITMPHSELRKRGWKADATFGEPLFLQMEHHGLLNPNGFKQLVAPYDIVIFPRAYLRNDMPEAHADFLGIIRLIQSEGKKVVYEVDDDFTNHHREVINGDAMRVVQACDAVTVTTHYLAEIMGCDKPTYILPNMVSKTTFGGKPAGTFRYSDKIVLGLTGSITHAGDWEVLKHVLPRIMQRDDVHLILGGYHPDYLRDLPNTTYNPFTAYGGHCQVLKRCDIILAPVNPDDGFNLGKSPIKVLEGMAASRRIGTYHDDAGAATIATRNPIYELAIQHEENGLLVEHTAEAWEAALLRLIEDAALRHKLQINGHRWVWKQHDIAKRWSLWRDAYQAIQRLP